MQGQSPKFMRGTMGLTGLWALIGNSTAMVVVSVVLFLSIFQVSRMHEEAMQMFRAMIEQERDHNKRVNESMQEVIGRNTQAIKELTVELRKK